MDADDWLGQFPHLPIPVELPASYTERVALAEACWQQLEPNQKTFLAAWRDCRYNQRAAQRTLGKSDSDKPMTRWMDNPYFETVVKIWRANAAANALDKDRLLARQDEIVETLLTPKPVLHQGLPVFDPRRPGEILTEVDAGAASRANEVLLDRALPKPRADVEVNVGVAFNPVKVEIEEPAGSVIDAVVEEVEASPVLPSEEDWLA
jgi:hypothetical protein